MEKEAKLPELANENYSACNGMGLRKNPWSEAKLALLCVVVGIAAGLSAVVFRWSIHFFHHIMWERFGAFLVAWADWAVMLVPVVGMLAVWLFLRLSLRKGEGHGVEEVMRTVTTKEGRIPYHIAPVECIASSLCMGSGGSVGPEGPMIQIGSGVGSFIGQIFKLDCRNLVLVTAAGAAGGLGAIFNAPIAGVIFAMEAVLEEFNSKGFCFLVIASVAATQVNKAIIGNRVLLDMKDAVWGQWPELVVFALMGIVGGIVGVCFVLLLDKTSTYFASLQSVPAFLKPVFGGVVLGLCALYLPFVLGEGYEYIDMAMNLKFTMGIFFFLVFAKIVSTVLTLSSGGSGGVFAPSLVMGAMFGGGCFLLANQIFPGIVGSPETYIAVGIATILGSAFKAPITAIIMVIEISNNYNIVLPLMIAAVCATFMSWVFLKGCSIYNINLIQEGVRQVENDFWVPRSKPPVPEKSVSN